LIFIPLEIRSDFYPSLMRLIFSFLGGDVSKDLIRFLSFVDEVNFQPLVLELSSKLGTYS
jgi:hypothetical protein